MFLKISIYPRKKKIFKIENNTQLKVKTLHAKFQFLKLFKNDKILKKNHEEIEMKKNLNYHYIRNKKKTSLKKNLKNFNKI